MFDLRYVRRSGHLIRFRDEWALWLVTPRRLVFGYYLDYVRRELVLIAGSRIVGLYAAGIPSRFHGGLHLTLGLEGWLSWLPRARTGGALSISTPERF